SPPGLRPWPVAVALAIAVPLGLLVYCLFPPASNVRLDDRVQHFAITTNISLIAAAVALLVARSALEMRHMRTLLVALGFLSLAGIFTVHGLSTPGVLLVGELRELGGSVIQALAAQLSLAVPGLFFAARLTPLATRLERSSVLTPHRLLAATGIALVGYGVIALTWPAEMSGMVETMTGYGKAAYSYAGYGGTFESYGPWVIAIAGGTIALLLFAAWRQSAQFARSHLPSHGALVLAFLLLAEAQVAMIVGPVFSLVFWEYHGLMATATLIALGSLFVELDRRRGLERFLPANVVERVIVGDSLSLEGQRRVATILFTDLRGSTALAERMTPEQAVATLNAYLRRMARAVIGEGGILDKFTGDGLMAIFGAMGDPGAGAQAAARAAMRMRADLGALNAERAARGELVVGYGIGMHTGEVVLGAVGLPERSDYTALGDTVNTAARMEGLTKELGVEAVLSAETVALLDGAVPVRPLGEARVKGKAEPLRVFTFA
ncbi:MAG: adenylate/guanylate cyclase domain-containing protein, partial [Chloroflexota bacterium]